jgi:tRNA(Ile)-lysidine synthase
MFPKKAVQKIVRYTRPLLPEQCSIIVAVSGGGDSVALLFLLNQVKRLLSIDKLCIAHINHGLRGKESDLDEQLVKQYADQLEIPFFTKKLTGRTLEDAGLELWAREERYSFLEKVRIAQQGDFIATGHTLDDQAETVLMRLLRGTGVNGLRGIAPLREEKIIRPLLQLRKKELELWLHDQGIVFRKDSSNDDCHLFRNRIRHTVLPLMEKCQQGAVRHLAALADDVQEKMSNMEEVVTDWIRVHLCSSLEESFCIKNGDIVSDPVSTEALRRLMTRWGITPRRTHIEGFFLNADRTGGWFLLPDGWRYFVTARMFYFEKKTPVFDYHVSVPGICDCAEGSHRLVIEECPGVPEALNMGRDQIFVDGDALGEVCRYRTMCDNDVFMPFGTHKLIPAGRFLAAQGIPLPLRKRTGCLLSGDNKIAWFPGIRLDERFRVTPSTTKVFKIKLERFL